MVNSISAHRNELASASPRIAFDRLLADLQQLCALPSLSGALLDLDETASQVAHLMQRCGLQAEVIATPGAPIAIGRAQGQLPTTLLFYHHYDVTPPGAYEQWTTPPFLPTLRTDDEALVARGAAYGKGPLVAHLHALAALVEASQLSCNVIVVAEGERWSGSPHLREALAQHLSNTPISACISSAGEFGISGQPLLYSGCKGYLRLRLRANGARVPIDAGMGAAVASPLWRIIWALASLKNQNEEINIDGFYDSLLPPVPVAAAHPALLDETGRRDAWGLDAFLFGLSSGMLVQSETSLPICHVAALRVETSIGAIPTHAEAEVEFQLVPGQQPQAIAIQVSAYLEASGFDDILVEALPGSYAAVQADLENPIVTSFVQAAAAESGAPIAHLPCGPFALPLAHLSELSGAAPIILGLERHAGMAYAPNEAVLLADLQRHSRMIAAMVAGQK